MSFTLGNGPRDGDGDYSPLNPASPWYGHFDLGAPVRHTIDDLVYDLYGRIVVDGWSSTTSGHVWTLSGTASEFDVGGSTGTITIAAASTTRRAYLAALAGLGDYEVIADLSLATPASGNNQFGLTLRGTSATSHATVEIDVTSAGVVRLALRDLDGTYLDGPTTVAGVGGGAYTLHALVEGSTIRGKLYNQGDPEPYDWTSADVSTSMSRVGWPGVRAVTGTGNTNVTYTIDNFRIRFPRFFGEITSLVEEDTDDGVDSWVRVDATSILGRLGTGQEALESVMRRAITRLTTNVPVAYWPCEDDDNATVLASGIGGPAMTILGEPTLSSFSEFRASKALPLCNGSTWTGTVPTYSGTSAQQTRFLIHVSATSPPADGSQICLFRTTGTARLWGLYFLTGGAMKIIADNQSGVQVYDSGALGFTLTGNKIWLSFELTQVGADIEWDLATLVEDGAGGGASGTLAGYTFGRFTEIIINDKGHLDQVAIGHILVQNAVDSLFTLATQLAGYEGETAIGRFERLCGEEEVDQATTQTPLVTSAPLGIQRPLNFQALLEELTEADQGMLGESRALLAPHFWEHGALYNQTAVIALDLAAKHLSPTLRRTLDTREVANDVTVSRTGGSSARTVIDSGRRATAQPPNGVGRRPGGDTVSVETDAQVEQISAWQAYQRTIVEHRFDKVWVDLARKPFVDDPILAMEILSADLGDKLTIDGGESRGFYELISQLIQGYTEEINARVHRIGFTTSPAVLYDPLVWDANRWDSGGTTLNEDLDTTETSVEVAISDGVLWTTSAGHMPFDIMIGGERMTVTAVSGASSPQTFTVTRSVNGVVKTHDLGDEVHVADERTWGL
ncbi:MAG TPA: hypothetical protein VGX25_05370 [Actinophytocola sp.]|uniref:hypothetical protein n=1 Tax=Actinophytocola sp. TaxID=1872138 RepID=UPI002DDCAE93|nr:hypothetical protein [Actinophytocola sp.]HEV2778812.1 hypothetical protein [Actinophytocola sp.]